MGQADLRQQLCNEQKIGSFFDVQVPLERITQLHALLWDLDAKYLAPGNAIFPPADEPRAFYELVKPVLDRHPLARAAEVRASGTGLHLILWLRPAVELRSAADQQRWANIVAVVQRTLPIDPTMPGITALTRPVGSVNSKNGATVETLKVGDAVEPKAIVEFMARLVKAPFKEVALILMGSEHVSPCPVCRGEGSRLDLLDFVGKCYGGCDKVKAAQVYDLVYRPIEKERKDSAQPSKRRADGQDGEKPTHPGAPPQGSPTEAGHGRPEGKNTDV
jgi:hypothetical protein